MSTETTVTVENCSELWLRLLELPVEQRLDALVADQGVDSSDPAAVEWLRKDHVAILAGDPRAADAVQLLINEDIWGRIREGVLTATRHVRSHAPDLVVPESISVTVALPQPYEDGEPEELVFGMNGPDGIWMCCWPTPDNLGEVGPAAAHELNHMLRFRNLPPSASFSLADWVVSEGLAEAFVVEVFGEDAVFLDYPSPADPEFESVWDLVVNAFDLAGDFKKMTAYVLGDPTARRHNSPVVGAPHMAGYGVGKLIVDRFLAKSGLSATEASRVPTSQILAGGLHG